MNQLPNSLAGRVLATHPTLLPATPPSGPDAYPPTVVVRANAAPVELTGPCATRRVNTDDSPAPVVGSSPFYHPLPSGLSPLGQAAYTGEIEQVLILIRQGCDLNVLKTGEAQGYTPLAAAAVNGHGAIVDLLLKAGADPNVRDGRNGRTALMYAAERGTVNSLRALLACPHLQIDLVCNAGQTALMLARDANHRDAVIALLGAGAGDVLTNGIPYASSLLSWAIGRCDGEMVRLMLAPFAAGSSRAGACCDEAVAHAVQLKCVDIVECLLEAGLAGSPTHAMVGTIVPESTTFGHASATSMVLNPESWEAGAPVYNKPAGAQIKLRAFFGELETYVPMIVIADLLLSCKPAPGFWPGPAPVETAPLQAFADLLPRLPAMRLAVVHVRESLLLHLHGRGMSVAVALSLADCLAGGYGSGVALLSNNGQAVNAQQKDMYFAAALNALKPQEQGQMAARIYASAGITVKGAERLVHSAQGQFNAVHELAGKVSALLGEQMLEQIMPACLKHTDGRYQVDVAGLAAALVASGLMRPLAQTLAETWKAAVGSLMAGPATIPAGASFGQVAHILDDALRRLEHSYFATGLLAALREASLLAALRQMTSTAPTDEALPMLFQIQADQLRQFAEQLQQA